MTALPFTFASSDYGVLLAKISPSRWHIGVGLKAKLCFCKSVIVIRVLTAYSEVNGKSAQMVTGIQMQILQEQSHWILVTSGMTMTTEMGWTQQQKGGCSSNTNNTLVTTYTH